MTTDSWLKDAFLDLVDKPTVVQAGTPWHVAPPRWGHRMHALCSYQGMFPARLAHYFIDAYSSPNQLVVDPFSGRGTTVLQALVDGRRAIAGDLSPLGYVLSAAKASPPAWDEVMRFVQQLEADYGSCSIGLDDVPEDIAMLFAPTTLRQVVFLRHALGLPGAAWTSNEFMVSACMAGILHGGTRKDGSSAFLSIDMPNTFSMSPDYVRRYIATHRLRPPVQDVFDCLRAKLARVYLDALPASRGLVWLRDAAATLTAPEVAGKADLILTSPPYLGVVNYASANWIRLWWLGVDEVGRQQGLGRKVLDEALDHGHGYAAYTNFMRRIFEAAGEALAPGGTAVFVIGDVASEGRSIPLAQQVWAEAGTHSGLRLEEIIEDRIPENSKVSRIWGETKGRATERDCALVLRRVADPASTPVLPNWDESSYLEAGPDAAHEMAAAARLGRSLANRP